MNLGQHIIAILIRSYQLVLSPVKNILFGPLARCRYTPTCSAYALEAVRKHGALKGGCLAVKRLCRCHPWGGCGHDPVPDERGRSFYALDPKQAGMPSALRGDACAPQKRVTGASGGDREGQLAFLFSSNF